MRGYAPRKPPTIAEATRLLREPGEGPMADTARMFDALVDSFDHIHEPEDRDPVLGEMIYELTNLMSEKGRASSGLIAPKAAQMRADNGRDHDPQPRNTPGLATPEKPRMT